MEQRIPILGFWNILLLPIQGEVSDHAAHLLWDEALERIHQGNARALIVDLTGAWMIDSHLCAMLSRLAAAASLMGTHTVFSGMSPEAALTLQTMGVEMPHVEFAQTLEGALELVGVRRDARAVAEESWDALFVEPGAPEVAPEPRLRPDPRHGRKRNAMTERLVKGFNLEQTLAFIDHHYSHDVRQTIHARLPAALEGKLATVKSGTWYPLADLVTILQTMAEVAESPDVAEDNARLLGQFLSHAATGGFMRLLLKVLTPPIFLKKVPDIWPRMFSFGVFESDPSGFSSGTAVMTMRDVDAFDFVAPVSVGSIESVFSSMGYPDATVGCQPVEGEPKGSAFRFDISWK